MSADGSHRLEQAYEAIDRLLAAGQTLFEGLASPSLAALIEKIGAANKRELELLVIFAVTQHHRDVLGDVLGDGESEEQAEKAFSAWLLREGGEALFAEWLAKLDDEAPAQGRQRRGGRKARRRKR